MANSELNRKPMKESKNRSNTGPSMGPMGGSAKKSGCCVLD